VSFSPSEAAAFYIKQIVKIFHNTKACKLWRCNTTTTDHVLCGICSPTRRYFTSFTLFERLMCFFMSFFLWKRSNQI